ncbi:hypothetical protein SAMN02799624_02518 [Paenibacillus sp. UNC496MF]|uniref:hypothetical protein n=1 Tax=Paenibacillus sp. UNC496MF TaxID=1502753 RepID=UPI0008E920CE|nr:hypothetical protein [Paenibacillus sp. UNC496MF]SFI89021.1 hypothetical protein SAMN02799624_02518 [Paenibacillus sp. UNC496MF]
MITTARDYRYTVFGLRVASEFELAELRVASAEDDAAGDAGGSAVEIRRGELAAEWAAHGAEAEANDDWLAFPAHGVLFRVPDVAIYRISDGERIVVSPFPGADDALLRLYLLGTCMGVLLMQRRMLPLHGSAVVIEGRAYAIVGESGAGKSTLAAAFLSRGCRLLTDDVIAVAPRSADGAPLVYPAYPQQKLWQASLERLGMDAGAYRPLYDAKFAVPVAARFCERPVPLAGAFELVRSEDDAAVGLRSIAGIERLPVLRRHTYRDFLIPLLGGEQWHFERIADLAGRIGLYRLSRPAVRFSAGELVDAVLEAVRGEARTGERTT